MKKLFTITIPPLSGKKLIQNSKLFGCIDPDFIGWEANEPKGKTQEQQVDVLEMTENATFEQMFDKKQVLTQEQILYFIKNHKDKLRSDGYATFFLFESKGNFFVALVGFDFGDSLYVSVWRFEHSYVWDAGDRHRVVVPQEENLKKQISIDPQDIRTLLNMLDGNTERKLIVNYVRKYIFNPSKIKV